MSRYLIFFLFFFVEGLYAQTYSFKTYSIEDGLPRSQVLCIFQQKEGPLWFGTAGGGVSRFDGKDFTTFNTRNGLVNNYVNAICQVRSGDLWFATDGGVSHFDGKNFESLSLKDGLCSSTIVGIFEDSRGNIWFRSLQEGVSCFFSKERKIISFTTTNGLPDNTLFDLTEDNQGHIWMASSQGAICYSQGKLRVFTQKEGLANDHVTVFLKTKAKKILFGTWGGGISEYTESASHPFKPLNGTQRLSSSIVLSLVEDEAGGLWAGTLGDGIFHFVNGKTVVLSSNAGRDEDYINKLYIDAKGNVWAISSRETLYKYYSGVGPPVEFDTRDGFNDDKVRCFFQDNEGNMWFGTYTGGVSKYNGDLFVSVGRKEGLGNTSVKAIAEEGTNLLIGTDGGSVSEYDKKSHRITSTYNTKIQVSSGFITCIKRDASGNDWVGTEDNGVSILKDGHRIAFFNRYTGISGSHISCILHSSSGKTYVCTEGGVTLFSGLKPSPFHLGKKNMAVEAAAEDAHHNLWFIRKGGEILVVKDGRLIHGRMPYHFSGAICSGTSVHDILLGTDDNGLLGFYIDNNDNIQQHVVLSPGEINNTSVTALCLYSNTLWIGTSKGIFSLDFTGTGSGKGKRLKQFTRDDGLVNPVINRNALFTDKDGAIWAGTVNGAARIIPALIPNDTVAPPTYITGVQLFYKSIDAAMYADSVNKEGLPLNLVLPYDKNQVTFDFIGVSLTAPSRVKYRYKLLGLDDNWSPETADNYVAYSNLLPGRYTFMVVSSNGQGVWGKVPATFNFSIRAPFYRTWWFYFSFSALILLVLYLLYRYRISQIRHNEGMQKRIIESEQKALRAQMNPHFIFNSLNSIQHFITDKDVKSANRYLSKFSRLMRLILDNSKKTFITLAEELDALRLYLDLESLRFENKFDFGININSDVDIYSIEIPPMLIQPYLENAIWHGFSHKEGKGEIIISFEMENNFLLCSIKDNGIGRKRSGEMKIEHPAQHTSSGMQITSERLQSVSELKGVAGSVEVIDLYNEKEESTGTLVNIRLPVE